MNKVKGTNRVKLFPNVWQVMFYENFTKSRANELFEDKRKFLEKSASNYFKDYESQHLQNVRKVEEYNNRLFNLSVTQFLAEVYTNKYVTVYPIVDVHNVKLFLDKHDIKQFPNDFQVPEVRSDREQIKHIKTSPVMDTKNRYITKYLLDLLLLGKYNSSSEGNLAVAYNTATNMNKRFIGDWDLATKDKLYGMQLVWHFKNGDTIILYCRHSYNTFGDVEPIVGERLEDKTILFPKPPSNLKVSERDFIKSINNELNTFVFDDEPLIETVDMDQRMRIGFEKKAKTIDNKFERRKMSEIKNLRKEIEKTIDIVNNITTDPTVKSKNIKQRRKLELQYEKRADEIVKEDIRRFKEIGKRLGKKAENQITSKTRELVKKNDVRAGEMIQFLQRLKRINEFQFKQKLENISIDDPVHMYKVAYEVREELERLLSDLTSPMGEHTVIQYTLKNEGIEETISDCIKRARKLYEALQEFNIVKSI